MKRILFTILMILALALAATAHAEEATGTIDAADEWVGPVRIKGIAEYFKTPYWTLSLEGDSWTGGSVHLQYSYDYNPNNPDTATWKTYQDQYTERGLFTGLVGKGAYFRAGFPSTESPTGAVGVVLWGP